MNSLLSDITDGEFAILEQILKNPGCSPADFFFDDPTIDGRIEMLLKHQLISLNAESQVFITELGRSALAENDVLQKVKVREHHFQLVQFWVPTAISVIALIVSIISLWS